MFIGKNFLVTVHDDPMRSVSTTIDRVIKNAPLIARAPDRLTYNLLDALLENYQPALDELAAEIAELESSVLSDPSADILNDVLKLKTEVQRLRQIVAPQREVIARLAHGEFKIVRAAPAAVLPRPAGPSLPHHRPRRQLPRLADEHPAGSSEPSADAGQPRHQGADRAGHAVDAHLIVTSYYGMNIKHMPELDWTYAHVWWVLGLGGMSIVILYLFLKRKGWW